STSPAGVLKRPRSTVDSRSRLSTTPLVQRLLISFGRVIGSFRRDHVSVGGSPALEFGKRTPGERALFRQGFLRSAQPLPIFAFRGKRQWWKQSEVDVHRLVRAH